MNRGFLTLLIGIIVAIVLVVGAGSYIFINREKEERKKEHVSETNQSEMKQEKQLKQEQQKVSEPQTQEQSKLKQVKKEETQPPKQPEAHEFFNTVQTLDLTARFSVLEKELAETKASGFSLAPEHYNRIESDLDGLENQGYSASEINRLRTIARDLAPYLQDQEKAQQASSPALSPSSTASSCASTANPQLIRDITDFSRIRKITAPGSPSYEGPKGHSFIWTEHERVPVYLPTAAVLDSGSYSKDNAESPAQYLLFFVTKDNCNFHLKFAHIDEPIATIKEQLPAIPAVADSRGTQVAKRLEFQAGDMIAYTSGTAQAGNWDFGLYDISKDSALAQYGSSGIHKNAVCWVDFYAPGKQEQYRRLLEGPKLLCSF